MTGDGSGEPQQSEVVRVFGRGAGNYEGSDHLGLIQFFGRWEGLAQQWDGCLAGI